MNQKIIEWIATVLAITGAIFNALAHKEGFYFWIVSNPLFMYLTYKNKHWGMLLVFLVYTVISVIGIMYWD